ncbi:MAG: hypothetical protein LBT89_10200 [Planctomycetaceae bacterium]|jgi:hypothetical protein|nr:hypothetical protein [Planctomycetaceae bacterium]
MKTLIKQTVLRGIDFCGLNRYARWKVRRKLLVLCYHAVVSNNSPADDRNTNIAVTVSQFEEQLQHLKKCWQPVSLREIRNSFANNDLARNLRGGQNACPITLFWFHSMTGLRII